MEIKVPASLAHLSQRKLVFANFMLKLIGQHGKRTAFYLYSKDVKKITDTTQDPHMNNLRDDFSKCWNMAKLNTETIRINWKGLGYTEGPTGLALTKTVEITDVDALNIYFYLLGRRQDPTLVTDRKPGDPFYTKYDAISHKKLQALDYKALQ